MDNFRWTRFFSIGPHCEYKVDACSQNKCRNSADCIIDGNNAKSYKCICPNGFTGNYCETNIDDCVNSRCLNNGKCIDKTNGYHCVCEKQFFGIYCEKARTPIKTVKKTVIKIGDFVNITTYVLVRNRSRVNIATGEKIIASRKLVLIMVRVIVIVVGSRAIVVKVSLPNIHLLKVSNRNTRTRCEICFKLPIKAPE